MKKLLSLTTLLFLFFAASAQKISVGVEGALPLGTFGDVSSFGIGGSIQGDYKIAPLLALTLNAGYINFSGKTVNGFKYGSTGLIPVLVGAKVSLPTSIYFSGQLGVSFSTASGGGTNFTYVPGIGFKFSKLDILAKYTGYSAKGGGSSSTIGLRAAIGF